jgi:hypothetical protein
LAQSSRIRQPIGTEITGILVRGAMPFVLLLDLLLRLEPPVAAPEPTYELRWSAPASCPTQADVIERIEGLLAGGRAPGVHVAAEAMVERAQDRWALTLRISTASGSRARTVTTESCDELAAVTALLIAIAVEPGLTGGLTTSAPLPVVEAPPPEAPPPEAPPEAPPEDPPEATPEGPPPEAMPAPVPTSTPTEPEPSSVGHAPPIAPSSDGSRRTLRGSAMAKVGLSTGVLPSVAPSAHVGGGMWWKLLGLQIRVVYRFPRPVSGGRAELWTLGADLRGCAVPRARSVLFPLCVGAELGTIAGRSFGISAPGRGRAPWLALAAAGGLVAMVGRRVGITVDAGLLVPLVRAGFVIEGLGELHRVGAVGLDASAGVEVFFP